MTKKNVQNATITHVCGTMVESLKKKKKKN